MDDVCALTADASTTSNAAAQSYPHVMNSVTRTPNEGGLYEPSRMMAS
jgi:hypothetical protein